MATPRVFVVTGSNKGVGKSIVKLLLQDEEQKIVYLTSRNEDLGKEAVKDLEIQGFYPLYHQLDITDEKSIERFRDYLVDKHGGLDVLVNNAGIAYKGASTAPFSEQAEVTNNCNFFGTLNTCDILFPILRTNARVCHVSSMVSEMCFPRLSEELKMKFKDKDLTREGLKTLITDFVTAAKEDKVQERGWPTSAYGVSKIGVSMMTILQQKDLDQSFPERSIIVNSCCPGLVDTDMTGGKYPNAMPPDQGAETPVYLALLPVNATEPRGSFLREKKVCPFPPV